MKVDYPRDAWDLLSPQLTEHRRERMLRTASLRTNHVRLIVQDVHQPHNVSACIRSAEAFGIQNIDVVSVGGKFKASNVARGVDSWVDITKHSSVRDCISVLHERGYVVASAFPHGSAVSLADLPVDRPIALAFGNEHEGLDSEWREASDFCFTIPMSGIVESLNISVSAAISLFEVSMRAKKMNPPETFYLSKLEQENLLNKWICQQISSWPLQLERLRGV